MATAEAGIAIVGGGGAFVTDALTWLLTESGSRVLGSYRDVTTLQEALRGGAPAPRVAIVDAEDPAAGPPAVAALRQAHPDLKILLLCEAVSPASVGCALEGLVDGVVLKSDAPAEMILAVRHVVEGRAVMPSGWHQASLEREAVVRVLSMREREVLDLAAAGLSNKEIAERLVISVNTVKFHLRGIYCSLGVHSRLQASLAMSRGPSG